MIRRFVAGETHEEAIGAARALNDRGIGAMLNLLGENVDSAEQASAAADSYVLSLKRIREAGLPDTNISVKLTQLGLDVSSEVCLENAERVLEAAAEHGLLAMLDMEAFPYVDPTLSVLRKLRDRFSNTGVAIQAYLRRTDDDVRRLAEEGVTVRMVKGAYLEPREVAFPRRSEIRRSYARNAATLLGAGCEVHLGTHDEHLLAGAKRFVRDRGIPPDRFEFQMLYGVRRDLQEALAGEGYRMRVYVPYGREWYPYLTRRMAERPANMWFFVSNLLRRRG